MSSRDESFSYLHQFLNEWCFDEVVLMIEASGSHPSHKLDRRGNPRTLAQVDMIENQIRGIINDQMTSLVYIIKSHAEKYGSSPELSNIIDSDEYKKTIAKIKRRINDLL